VIQETMVKGVSTRKIEAVLDSTEPVQSRPGNS
jgi:transposase-like protein